MEERSDRGIRDDGAQRTLSEYTYVGPTYIHAEQQWCTRGGEIYTYCEGKVYYNLVNGVAQAVSME